jgi:hypothetical protein
MDHIFLGIQAVAKIKQNLFLPIASRPWGVYLGIFNSPISYFMLHRRPFQRESQ